MPTLITATHIRTAALTVAGCGVACSFAFFAFSSGKGGFPTASFVSDALPYVMVAIAGTLAGTRTVAGICVAASLCVLAVGVYTYINWVRFPAPTYINDIELSTYPLKWLFALIGLSVAVVGFVVRKIKHAQASL
jgi:hypothetical protein